MCQYGTTASDNMVLAELEKDFLLILTTSKTISPTSALVGIGTFNWWVERQDLVRRTRDKLCRAILSGIRQELANSSIIGSVLNDVMAVSTDNFETTEDLEEYFDDTSGAMLDTHLVREARMLEMKKFYEHKV